MEVLIRLGEDVGAAEPTLPPDGRLLAVRTVKRSVGR
jgi:hypothetical protein